MKKRLSRLDRQGIYTHVARAFTLIELLIVVAIIAVVTASSMAVITGPMFERVRAEDQEAFEAGAGIFFATLVQDAHRATIMQAGTSGTITLLMDPQTSAPRNIKYAVNELRTLTRAVDNKQVSSLVPAVQSLTAEKLSTGSLWNVTLTGYLRGYDGRPTTVSRRMDILAGSKAWTGGAS